MISNKSRYNVWHNIVNEPGLIFPIARIKYLATVKQIHLGISCHKKVEVY